VVYGKKTDFKADELLFQAVSPGGYSRYPAEDVPAARLLADYVRDSGFGKFDAMSLQKATAGKVAYAGISLGLYSEGMSGQCSPKDMELMFQLIHQYATNARFNQKDFESFIQRYRSRLANRELDPQQVFGDKLSSAMYDHSPYRRPITVEDLDRIDLRRMEQIYLDRFADLSDFTFIFVGNYDEQQLLDCANRYLANLPKARRKDRIVDAGVRLFKGQKLELFRKGESDRSFVSHVTNCGYKATPQNDMNLNALTLVLNEKLRENIREDLSGVYLIYAWPGKERYPKPSLTFSSMMACSPARVEELNRAIFATLDSIRAGYIDDRYLVSTKATLTKTLEEDLRTNYYWLNQIYNSVWQKKPLEGFLAMPSLVDKIDRRAVAKTAKKYLTFDRNKLSVIMLPAPRNE
jgi:zinc protease